MQCWHIGTSRSVSEVPKCGRKSRSSVEVRSKFGSLEVPKFAVSPLEKGIFLDLLAAVDHLLRRLLHHTPDLFLDLERNSSEYHWTAWVGYLIEINHRWNNSPGFLWISFIRSSIKSINPLPSSSSRVETNSSAKHSCSRHWQGKYQLKKNFHSRAWHFFVLSESLLSNSCVRRQFDFNDLFHLYSFNTFNAIQFSSKYWVRPRACLKLMHLFIISLSNTDYSLSSSPHHHIMSHAFVIKGEIPFVILLLFEIHR